MISPVRSQEPGGLCSSLKQFLMVASEDYGTAVNESADGERPMMQEPQAWPCEQLSPAAIRGVSMEHDRTFDGSCRPSTGTAPNRLRHLRTN